MCDGGEVPVVAMPDGGEVPVVAMPDGGEVPVVIRGEIDPIHDRERTPIEERRGPAPIEERRGPAPIAGTTRTGLPPPPY